MYKVLFIGYFLLNVFYISAQSRDINISIIKTDGIILYKLILYKSQSKQVMYAKSSQAIVLNNKKYYLGDGAYLLRYPFDKHYDGNKFLDDDYLKILSQYKNTNSDPTNTKYFRDTFKYTESSCDSNFGGETFYSKYSVNNDTFYISYQIKGTFAIVDQTKASKKIKLKRVHYIYPDNSVMESNSITITPLSINGYKKLSQKQRKKLGLIRCQIDNYIFCDWD